MTNFFQRSKTPKNSICSEILEAGSFNLIPHTLSWGALKKVKMSEPKIGASINFQKKWEHRARFNLPRALGIRIDLQSK